MAPKGAFSFALADGGWRWDGAKGVNEWKF